MANQKERAFTGVWIPKHIWLNDELSPIEKLFLAEIESLDNDVQRGCFASNEYFGNFFKISEGRAANIISGLRRRGYIKQVFFDGKVRGIRLHENVKAGFTPDGARLHENVKAGFTKRGKQVSRKREHTNIVDNKVNNKEEEKAASLFSSTENQNFQLEAEKEKNDLQNGAAGIGADLGNLEAGIYSLRPPFTKIAEIEPQPAKVVRLYDSELPGVTVIDSVPGTYETPPPENQPGEFKRVNIGEEIERIRNDYLLKENFTRTRRIPESLFADYVAAFELEASSTGETYANVPALRKHFLNWCGCRYEHSLRKATKLNGNNRSQINHAGGDLSKYQEPQKF